MTRPYRDHAACRKDQEELVLARIDRFAPVNRAGRHHADLSALSRRLADPSTFDASLAALRSPEPPDPWLTEVSDLHQLVARRAAASPQSPLDALARRLGLASHEVDVLRLLWVTQTSPLVHRLIRALWTDQDSGPQRLDVVTCLLADDDATRRALQLALSSGAALRRWRLVIAPDLSPGPWLPLEVPEAVLRILEGDARAAARGHEEVEADDAVAACQGQIDAVFEGRAARIDAAFDWKDLVLRARRGVTDVVVSSDRRAPPDVR